MSCNAECAPPSSRLLNPPQSSAHSPSDHPPLAACRHFPWPARCLLFAHGPAVAQRPVAETSPGLPCCGNLLLCPSRPAIAIDKPLSTSSTAPPQAYGARAASRPSGGARQWAKVLRWRKDHPVAPWPRMITPHAQQHVKPCHAPRNAMTKLVMPPEHHGVPMRWAMTSPADPVRMYLCHGCEVVLC